MQHAKIIQHTNRKPIMQLAPAKIRTSTKIFSNALCAFISDKAKRHTVRYILTENYRPELGVLKKILARLRQIEKAS